MVPEVTLENSGILVSGAAYGGISFIPGFPVWTICSWLCTKLVPFGNLAWRVALGSGVAAALACGLVALMVSRGGRLIVEESPGYVGWNLAEHRTLRLVSGIVAGLALGLSRGIWPYAVVADVWTLKVLIFSGMICLLMRWTAAPERRRYLYWAFLFYGLLIANGEEMVVLVPGLIVLVMVVDPGVGRDICITMTAVVALGWHDSATPTPVPWLQYYVYRDGPLVISFEIVAAVFAIAVALTGRVGTQWRSALMCAVLFLFGSAAYYLEPIAGMTTPPVNWDYPRTVEGFMHLMTLSQFERLNPTRDLATFAANLWKMTIDIASRFGWYYIVFILMTFCVFPWANRVTRKWVLGLGALFCCVDPLMVAIFNPAWDRHSRELMARWFCCVYVILALWSGLGLAVFGTMIARHRRATE